MTNPNDFAFSDMATRLQEISKDGIKAYHPPLTKLEYFAAMAMQGIASNNEVSDTENWVWLAKASVTAAKELINALNQDNESTRT